MDKRGKPVIPAKAGIQELRTGFRIKSGMTPWNEEFQEILLPTSRDQNDG